MSNDLDKTNVIIENRIFIIRGQKVMIDRDLAELYGVKTKRLNEAVKRNIKRFPDDFMFQLTDDEQNELVANCDHLQNLRYSYQNAYAFTEQGVAMLATVLNSETAINVNIQIMRAFVKLRHYAISTSANSAEIEELRRLLLLYIEKNDKRVNEIICVLNNLIEKPRETKQIGFIVDK